MKKELLYLKTSPHLALEKLYLNHRNSFFKAIKKYDLSSLEKISLYQKSFISLREYCISGALEESALSLKQCLLSVGEMIVRAERMESGKPLYDELPWEPMKPFDTIPLFEVPNITYKQRQLGEQYKALGKRCQEMLMLFYYRKLSIPEIIHILGHETEVIVRKQKTRCLQALKASIDTLEYETHEDLIDAHIQQYITPEQQQIFIQLLVEDDAFRDTVDFAQNLSIISGSIDRKDFFTTMTAFEAKIALKKTRTSTFFFSKKSSTSAIMIIATALFMWLCYPYFYTDTDTHPDTIYQSHFSPYPNKVVVPSVPSDQYSLAEKNAFEAYDHKEYQRAAVLFDTLFIQQQESYFLFYHANCLLASAQLKKAIILLEKHIQTQDVLSTKSQWYLALAYLKNGQKKQAIPILESIVLHQSYKHTSAQKILKSL